METPEQKESPAESEGDREYVIDRARKYCKMVAGKLSCAVGIHDFVETQRKEWGGIHRGNDWTVHLRCQRPGCKKVAHADWHEGEPRW